MKRVLFANPFGIGDAVFTLWSVEKLRREQPDAYIGFVGNERTAELLALYPGVNRVHVFNRDALRASLKKSPFHYWAAARRLVAEIRSEGYDTLVDFSLGREFALAARFAGISERAGFDFKGRGLFLSKKKKLEGYEGVPVAQRQLDFLREAGIFSDNRLPESLSFRVEENLDVDGELVVFAPGGGRSWGKDAVYKQWDAALFARAASTLVQKRPGLRIALLGDEAERPVLEQVRSKAEGAIVLAGQPLFRVCTFLKKARLVIGNDGGLMHLANALGTRTVTIFGPVDERAYAPYGGEAARRVVVAPVECRPCYSRFHFPPCPHERRCLTSISIDKVIEPALEIL